MSRVVAASDRVGVGVSTAAGEAGTARPLEGVRSEVRAECLMATPCRPNGEFAAGGADRATAGNSGAGFAPAIGPPAATDFDLLGSEGDGGGEETTADASNAALA
jgi:hypothetical protein